MKHFKFFVAAMLLLSLIAIAGCNRGGDTQGDEPTPTPAAEATPTPTPEPAPDTGMQVEEGTLDAFDETHPLAALFALQDRFPASMVNGETPIQGGDLRVATVSDTPFRGVFHPVFAMDVQTTEIAMWFGGISSVFSSTPLRSFGQHGIVTFTFDREEKSFTLTQVEDVYWHDGAPLTLDDLVYSFEVIAHPDYLEAGGGRYDESVRNVLGVIEYNAGEIRPYFGPGAVG